MSEFLLYSNILLWIVVLVFLVLFFMIFRQFGEVYLSTSEGISRDGIPVGESFPKFPEQVVLKSKESTNSITNLPELVVFVSPNCGACKDLLSDWNKYSSNYKNLLNLTVVIYGTREESQKMLEKTQLKGKIVLDENGELTDNYKVRVTPFAFILDEKGVVKAKGLCNGEDHIKGLMTMLNKESIAI
ncbi:redoxin domain-containing protein [Bacillus sp. FJAT-27251]|uniref:redoxin domain-containing protein n=1 Tax=Bacillus sp. FJAT-27251 TaxID=1684142 RepID=UPI0006A77242|nr:redoxin domain-containing protein [Bacillus sp. FJAT-27251]